MKVSTESMSSSAFWRGCAEARIAKVESAREGEEDAAAMLELLKLHLNPMDFSGFEEMIPLLLLLLLLLPFRLRIRGGWWFWGLTAAAAETETTATLLSILLSLSFSISLICMYCYLLLPLSRVRCKKVAPCFHFILRWRFEWTPLFYPQSQCFGTTSMAILQSENTAKLKVMSYYT